MIRALTSLGRDRRGGAAVEFALLAPFLAIVLIGIMTAVPLVNASQKMRDGVSAGALYVMTGRTNTTSVRDVVMAAWSGRANADTVTVTQFCTCSGVECACGGLCADGTVPVGFIRIQTATTVTTVGGTRTLTANQLVRTK